MAPGLSSLSKYKLGRKDQQIPPWNLTMKAIRKGLLSHLLLQPASFFFLFSFLGFKPFRSPLPSFTKAFFHLMTFQFLESLCFYLSHRLLHTSFLYKVWRQYLLFLHSPKWFTSTHACRSAFINNTMSSKGPTDLRLNMPTRLSRFATVNHSYIQLIMCVCARARARVCVCVCVCARVGLISLIWA